MSEPDLTQQYWHPMVNDEIGGWAVSNYNTDATSKLDHRLGHQIVADCLNEQIARRIVQQHNNDLRERDRYARLSQQRELFDELILEFRTGTSKFAVQQQVVKGSPAVAYVYTLDKMIQLMTTELERHARG
jgi:hypothetical protein